jgi:hypothetical protein
VLGEVALDHQSRNLVYRGRRTYEPFTLQSSLLAPDPAVVGGAVRAAVARVELVLSDGRTVSADTAAAPQLGGGIGRELRFFLIDLPVGAEPVTRRLFDAAGTLVDEQDLRDGIESRGLRGRSPVRFAWPPESAGRHGPRCAACSGPCAVTSAAACRPSA